jgi:nucleoside-diphosphate-sugar epimerase
MKANGHMRLLLLGGTRFLGPYVVHRLVEAGHSVAVFHRGQTQANLPDSVPHVLGERNRLSDSTAAFRRFAPQVVIDMIAYSETDALGAVTVFKGISDRLVVLSSMDVYRAYGRFLRMDSSPPDPLPLNEDSPVRQSLYPYRAQARDDHDLLYHYEKIAIEQAVFDQPGISVTVLRLPCVYGPGDYQHRAYEHLKRMDDGRSVILLGRLRSTWRWTRGYVENVAAAIALAATDERAAGQIYNVGEEQALTETEWVQGIGRAAAWSGQVRVVPDEDLPSHLKTPFDWRHDIVGDTGKIRRQLKYIEPISMEEAMRRTVTSERTQPPQQYDSRLFDYAAEDAVLEKLLGV